MTITFTGGGVELESLLDSADIEKVRLECRSVRFGSYKVVPQDTIVLTEHGVKLRVTSLMQSCKFYHFTDYIPFHIVYLFTPLLYCD